MTDHIFSADTGLYSKLESFLGDPAFPKVAIESSLGWQIHLYQDLYMRYSRMRFTHPQDRPIAIASLEKRLIHGFGAQGGFGVFHGDNPGQLRRGLLWQRASDVDRLKVIDFRITHSLASGSRTPPTWSWMAYEGGIEYPYLPFGQIEWEADEILPVGVWDDNKGSAADFGLSVVARDFNNAATPTGRIILDIPNKTNPPVPALKCVILGRLISGRQREQPMDTRIHFILLVTTGTSPAARDEPVYHRVGVGSVPGSWIQLDGPVKVGKIL